MPARFEMVWIVTDFPSKKSKTGTIILQCWVNSLPSKFRIAREACGAKIKMSRARGSVM